MSVTVTDFSEITDKVEAMLKANPELTQMGTTILQAEPINENPSACPWVGIYSTGVQLPSRAMGMGAGYRQQRAGIALIVQHTHVDSGKECKKLLEDLMKKVINVLINDESLGGVVDVLDEIQIDYQNYGQVQSAYMQTAVIQLVGVVNVRSGG